MKTRCLSCGGTMKKMQNGGSTRPVPGQKKPGTKELKITSAMTNGIKSPNLPPKKRGTGLILKDKSKFQEGVYKPTMQTGGGFPITAKAAARKVGKGKGMMTYKYGTTDAPGTGNNKGAYVKFAKDQESNPYGGKSLKGSRSRRVMQMGGGIKKMQNGGLTKADPYGVSSEKKRYDKSGGNMGPTKIVRKKVDPKAPKPSRERTVERNGTMQMQKGGVMKYQNGGITKDGQKINFPPIVKKEAVQESVQPTKQTAFEKRQNRKIEKAKTRSAVASIEGEGTVKDKRNNRANRIATVVGTGRQKVSRTSSTSTTSNTNSNNTNVSSGSDSGSTSGSRSTSGSSSGSTSGVSGSGNSQNANETNNNSKNKRYQKGGPIGTIIIRKPTPKKPTVKKTIVNKGSNSLVIGSGNSSNNNSVNNNSNNRKIVITKKDNSVNKSTNSRNRYQKGGSTSSVINSGNSNNRNTVNNNSNNTKIYKKKVDNSVNKSINSRNTRIEKAKQKNVKVDRNRPIGGTYPFTFK